MANYDHCEASAMNVACPPDDDDGGAHDLAMLPAAWAECALQIEPWLADDTSSLLAFRMGWVLDVLCPA